MTKWEINTVVWNCCPSLAYPHNELSFLLKKFTTAFTKRSKHMNVCSKREKTRQANNKQIYVHVLCTLCHIHACMHACMLLCMSVRRTVWMFVIFIINATIKYMKVRIRLAHQKRKRGFQAHKCRLNQLIIEWFFLRRFDIQTWAYRKIAKIRY